MKKFLIVFAVVAFLATCFYLTSCYADINQAKVDVQQPKCNLQFNKATSDYILANAGLTDEEALIFQMRGRGHSLVQISMNTGYSESAIQSKIRKIKTKIIMTE